MMGWGLTFFSIPEGRAQEATAGDVGIGSLESYGSLSDVQILEKTEKDFYLRVEAPVLAVRNSFYFFCKDLSLEFRNILGMRPADWDIPIHVSVQGDDRDKVFGNYLATKIRVAMDDSLSIWVYVKLHDQFDEDTFAREFVRALLLEQMIARYKDQSADLPGKIKAPDWMVHGFSQLIAHRRNGRPSAFFAGYIKSGQLLSVKEIFARKNPDSLNSLSLAAYDASATALVDALRTQEGGKDALIAVIRDLPTTTPDKMASLIRQHFPALREVGNGLEKWWALQIATMGRQQTLEFFDSEETNRLIGEALKVSIAAKKDQANKGTPKEGKKSFKKRFKLGRGKKEESKTKPPSAVGFEGTLDQYLLYRKHPDWKESLGRNYVLVQQLKARGFPLYRPLLDRYEKVIISIIKNQLNGLEKEFATLAEMRERIRSTMEATNDYLNLYEAASAPEKSDAFDSYIRMRQSLDRAPPPKRNDRISQYLDAIEKMLAE